MPKNTDAIVLRVYYVDCISLEQILFDSIAYSALPDQLSNEQIVRVQQIFKDQVILAGFIPNSLLLKQLLECLANAIVQNILIHSTVLVNHTFKSYCNTAQQIKTRYMRYIRQKMIAQGQVGMRGQVSGKERQVSGKEGQVGEEMSGEVRVQGQVYVQEQANEEVSEQVGEKMSEMQEMSGKEGQVVGRKMSGKEGQVEEEMSGVQGQVDMRNLVEITGIMHQQHVITVSYKDALHYSFIACDNAVLNQLSGKQYIMTLDQTNYGQLLYCTAQYLMYDCVDFLGDYAYYAVKLNDMKEYIYELSYVELFKLQLSVVSMSCKSLLHRFMSFISHYQVLPQSYLIVLRQFLSTHIHIATPVIIPVHTLRFFAHAEYVVKSDQQDEYTQMALRNCKIGTLLDPVHEISTYKRSSIFNKIVMSISEYLGHQSHDDYVNYSTLFRKWYSKRIICKPDDVEQVVFDKYLQTVQLLEEYIVKNKCMLVLAKGYKLYKIDNVYVKHWALGWVHDIAIMFYANIPTMKYINVLLQMYGRIAIVTPEYIKVFTADK